MTQPTHQFQAPAHRWRLPAEFEPQQALIVAWPHAATDWAPDLPAIRNEIAHLIETALRYQPVILLHDPDDKDPVPPALLADARLHIITLPFDDTWARDFAPIGLVNQDQLMFLDFEFNAWGKPYANVEDNKVTKRLSQSRQVQEILGPVVYRKCDFILEGGAIESNGHGAVLINWHCLETRHPTLSREEIKSTLIDCLYADQILGIDVPGHLGDDTDGHIDTLARFIGPTTVAVQALADKAQTERLIHQLSDLRLSMGSASDTALDLVILPWPDGATDLPKNYANFIFLNGAVLLPVYGVPTDSEAQQILKKALPAHDIIPIEACMLATQFGGPHCTSMHIPRPQPTAKAIQ